jgi:hypothetical protein
MRVVSSASGIVVAETFDGRVPDGRELLYEQRFAEEYPYVVHDQIAAGEMREFQVLGLGYDWACSFNLRNSTGPVVMPRPPPLRAPAGIALPT